MKAETQDEEDKMAAKYEIVLHGARYIMNPLLLDKKKFDIRAYVLISSTVPFLVLYCKGYIRLSMYDYDNNSDNIIAHLTNQFIQKRDPMYKENKEETAWSMDRFNDYINTHVAPKKGLESDWVYNTMTNKMKQIILYTFHSVKARLQTKVGYFELYGLDFMVDEDMKVFLIEVNINPCLATNCEALKEVVPGVVREALYLSVECFEKARKGRPLMPLQSLRNFTVLYNGSPKIKPTSSSPPNVPRNLSAGQNGENEENESAPIEDKKSFLDPNSGAGIKSVTPIRRSKSLSPLKDHQAPASGTLSATLHSGISSDNEQSTSSDTNEPLIRRARAKHRSPVFPATSPLHSRGLVPKATSTINGTGFRKSTFPSLVDQNSTKVSQPLSSVDPIRLKMTHAGPQWRLHSSRTKANLDLQDTGLLTTTKFSRGS